MCVRECVHAIMRDFTLVLNLVFYRVVMSNLNHVKLSPASYERLPLAPVGQHLIEGDWAVAPTENTGVMSSVFSWDM